MNREGGDPTQPVSQEAAGVTAQLWGRCPRGPRGKGAFRRSPHCSRLDVKPTPRTPTPDSTRGARRPWRCGSHRRCAHRAHTHTHVYPACRTAHLTSHSKPRELALQNLLLPGLHNSRPISTAAKCREAARQGLSGLGRGSQAPDQSPGTAGAEQPPFFPDRATPRGGLVTSYQAPTGPRLRASE